MIKWWQWWTVSFDGMRLSFSCPLFAFLVSYGAPLYTEHAYWWGFVIHYKCNKSIKPGDLMFLKQHIFEFRRYPMWKVFNFNGSPL